MPCIQKRLDYWLADNALQEEIDQVDTIPSINSDHSAILLTIKGIENESRGPSFRKFNASLLDDKEYVDLKITAIRSGLRSLMMCRTLNWSGIF